jgi:catechol 2,3-dioxygenase-like lactoylglutathione lyase family enzyme
MLREILQEPTATQPREAAMSSAEVRSTEATAEASVGQIDMKLEVVVIPVSDVNRAADFYERLGWRKDADIVNGDSRLLQLTPPGSPCSIIFGTGITPSAPGSTQFLHLVVSDIEAARDDLLAGGADPSEVYHDARGGYDRFDPNARASGPDPERRSYASFVTFNDPDGNGWVLQEITTRFAGRIDSDETAFASVSDLASAMRRASIAHGEHEKRIGEADANWPEWYAEYIVAEQAGGELPT